MTLSRTLDHLESSDLVRRLSEAELAYLIKHTLVQETVQASLLKQDRKRLHRLVAKTMEDLYDDRLDEYATRLFQHYDAAGEADKTIVYGERAGDAAARVSAYGEAIASYARAFELAQARADDATLLIRLMTQLGRAYELDANYDAAIALYRETRDFARARGERAVELGALVQLAKVLAVGAMRYDPKESERVAGQALALAGELNDEHAQARVLWAMLLLNLYGAGGARVSIPFGERSLALARALDWREQIAYTLNDLSYAYLNVGESARSRESTRAAAQLWRELDNKPMLTDSLNKGGMDALLVGEFEAASASAAESRTLSLAIGNRWGESTGSMVEGYIAMTRGDYISARAAFHACLTTGEPIGIHGPILIAQFELAKMYAYFGQVESGAQQAREALERTRGQEIDWNAWAYATVAEVERLRGDAEAAENALAEIEDAPPAHFFERILPPGAIPIVLAQTDRDLRRGRVDAAEARVEQLLAFLEHSNFQIFLPAALEKRTRIHMRQRDWENASRVLEQARIIAETLGMPQARFEIALAQWDLETARDDTKAAKQARVETQREMNALLRRVPDDWRDAYLRTPLAQRVIDNG